LAKEGAALSTKRVAIAIELDHPVPWHHDCYQGILQYAQENDWSCVVDPYLVGMTGQSDVSDYDGVVGRINAEVAEAARAHDIPVVNHWYNSPVDGLPSVLFDHLAGGRLGGEHLISCGYPNFAYVGVAGQPINAMHVRGMTEAVTAHGFSAPVCVDVEYDFESTREGVIRMRRLLTSWLAKLTPPVGVLCQSCITARYLVQICGEMNLRVPEDVGVVVQLGDTVVVASASPTLSVVDLDYLGLGYESAAMLDKLMNGLPAEPSEKLITPKRLIVRESSDFFVSADPMVSDAMRYIAGHCRQSLRVEEVAEALNTSRRTLERRFEEFVGRTIYGEISRQRTDYIKRALVETDRPLAAIAHDCGFSSVSHFTRFFRREAGTTPSSYRKQHALLAPVIDEPG